MYSHILSAVFSAEIGGFELSVHDSNSDPRTISISLPCRPSIDLLLIQHRAQGFYNTPRASLLMEAWSLFLQADHQGSIFTPLVVKSTVCLTCLIFQHSRCIRYPIKSTSASTWAYSFPDVPLYQRNLSCYCRIRSKSRSVTPQKRALFQLSNTFCLYSTRWKMVHNRNFHMWRMKSLDPSILLRTQLNVLERDGNTFL